MKIIGRDNHAREFISDEVWLETIPNNILFKEFAQRICDKLNEHLGDRPGRHYTIENDMYKPFKFEGY